MYPVGPQVSNNSHLALADMVEQERVPFLDHSRLGPVEAIRRLVAVAEVTLGARLVHR